MQRHLLIAAIILLLFSTSCENENIRPSANITVEDRTVYSYQGIEISTVFDVELTISSTEEKIEIEANENLHAYIDVLKEGDDLVIKLKDNTSITGNATLKARITTSYPLDKITLSQASRLTMNNELSIDHILLAVADACYMNAKINSTTALVRLEGASRIDLSGTSDQMELYIFDACELNGLEMIVGGLTAEMEGASNASLTVNETIDLTAKDATVFTYRGDAVITNIDLRDAAQIIKLD